MDTRHFTKWQDGSVIAPSESGFDLFEEYRSAIEAADFDKKRAVLVLCEDGVQLVRTLLALGYRVTVPDTCLDTLSNLGIGAAEQVSYVTLGNSMLPCSDNSISSVVGSHTFCLSFGLDRALSEIARVLKPNGSLLILNQKSVASVIMDNSSVDKRSCQEVADVGAFVSRLQSLFEEVFCVSMELNDFCIAAFKREAVHDWHAGCFACGVENRDGLQLNFELENNGSASCDTVVSRKYQGYENTIQGGIVSTILDSAMTNCLQFHGVEAMTARMNVRFSKPIQTENLLRVTAKITQSKRGIYQMEASIVQDGSTKASATAQFMQSPEQKRV